MSFIMRWKVAGLFLMPMGMTVHSSSAKSRLPAVPLGQGDLVEARRRVDDRENPSALQPRKDVGGEGHGELVGDGDVVELAVVYD
jgi:hypothetical protein